MIIISILIIIYKWAGDDNDYHFYLDYHLQTLKNFPPHVTATENDAITGRRIWAERGVPQCTSSLFHFGSENPSYIPKRSKKWENFCVHPQGPVV